MINFIACIDFRGLRGKNIHLESKHHDKTIQNFTQSYKDDFISFKHNGSDKNLGLFINEHGKFLVFTEIFEEDRQVLINRLGINENFNIKDSELVMEFYLKFGATGMQCLSNGFVFILIDLIKKNVLAFRDHIGIKNVCYFETFNSIYLSSSFKNLFNLKNKKFTLNLDKVNSFLSFNDLSNTNTFINEINKVPPSYFIEYHQSQIKIIQYSKYKLKDNLASDNDQINGLKQLLIKSVSIDRSCKHKKIGFLFSGGLDSSTIISFFRAIKKINHKIFSFSSQYKNIDKGVSHLIDESSYQDEINNLDDINSFPFDGGSESTLSDIDFYLEVVGQPFFFPNLYLSKKSFSLASDKGVGLVMNGNDGDTVISHGYEYFQELFLTFKWIRLYREINKTASIRSQSKRFIFKRAVLDQLSFTFSNSQLRYAKKKHLKNISTSNHSKAIEIQSLVANYYGVEERYPFYNRELIEYCINVTPNLKNKDGHERFILKEAIKGVVPEKIRKRHTKSNLAHALCKSFVEKDSKIIGEELSNPSKVLKNMFEINDLRDSWNKLKKNPRKYATRSSVPSKIFSFVVLNRWLRANSEKLKLEETT